MTEQPDLTSRVDHLLYELCVNLGFCLPPDAQHQLRTSPPPDPDSFADAVFVAEGMDPRLYKHLRRQVRHLIDRHMSSWNCPPDNA